MHPSRTTLFWLLLFAMFSTLLITGRATVWAEQPQSYCTTTVMVNSAFGSTTGSGSYTCGAQVTFSVFPGSITNGGVRHIFSGWSCSGAGCYAGASDPASITTGGNNSVTSETAEWRTEYLLTVSTTGQGSTTPNGSLWEEAGAQVSIIPEAPGASGWFFAYWSLDSQVNAGSPQQFTLDMDSPHSVTANFVKLNLTTRLLNVSIAGGDRRNPDGTFYRGDAFLISYNISEVGGLPLPSGITTIPSFSSGSGVLEEVSPPQGASGTAEFEVLNTSPFAPHEVSLLASLQNGNVLVQSPSSSSQPFAVVQYDPIFSCFTYMEYNNLSSTTYARPFVTLVRYNGNVPGYSYAGDANTDPFESYNSTQERAILNNFTFYVEGWSVSTSSAASSSLGALDYNDHNNLNIGVRMLNSSYPDVITWKDRVWKFYFNSTEIQSYVSENSIIYFNVSESAWYSLGAVKNSDFKTSYLYEPLSYNGYLVFKNTNNASIVAHNPDPLNMYLLQKVEAIFGGDSDVMSSFKLDLYPAYNSTMTLKPFFQNTTEEVFLINQTNIMIPSESLAVPYFTISVHGIAGVTTYAYAGAQLNPGPPLTSFGQLENVTYNVTDSYSLYLVNDFSPPAPFPVFTAYFIAEAPGGFDLVMQPTSFSFVGSEASTYLVRTYGHPEGPFFLTREPGNLTQDYQMLYGKTVEVGTNFEGGGITGFAVSKEGPDLYEATIQTDSGIVRLLVEDSEGKILYNGTMESSEASIVSFNPSQYVGSYTFEFPVYSNGTVSVESIGAWGAVDKIVGIQVTSSYGERVPTGVSGQITDIVWYLLVPLLFVFWYVSSKLRKRGMSS